VWSTGCARLKVFPVGVKRTGEAAEKSGAINWREKAYDESEIQFAQYGRVCFLVSVSRSTY